MVVELSTVFLVAGLLPIEKLIDDFDASWDVSADDPLPTN